MGRVFMTGAEAGTTDVWTTVASLTVSTVQKRTGSYSFAALGVNQHATKVLPAPLTELYIRMGVYPLGWGVSATVLLSLFTSLGHYQLYISVNPVTGLMRAERAGDWVTLATGTHPLLLNQWQCIEVYIKVANAGGRFVIKIEGVTDIDYTGDTNNVDGDVQVFTPFWLVDYDNMLGYIDDIAINDTTGAVNNSWIGRGGIYPKYMTGVGTYTDLHAFGHANPWDCISEVPPDDADYVYDDTVNQKSVYAGSVLTPTTGTIDAINVIMRAKLDAAGTGNIARLIRSNGVDSQGADVGLDTSPKTIQDIIETDPSGGGAWTIARVNALEAGAVVR